MSKRIGVMYLGKLVEIGPAREVVLEPCHPYTVALIQAVPEPDPKLRSTKRPLMGDVPSPIDRPTGCPFHPRCKLAQAICNEDDPKMRELSENHFVACHFA
jgi:peptide/nickel transport system ATP-binding protein